MKSEQGIGDMKWKGRKAERERGHSVLFLMRWSSDISALRGSADPLPVAAGSHPAVWRRLAECRPADQCIYNINQPKEKGKSDHNVFYVRVCLCEAWCVFSWFASSAACLLMRGDLTDCPMWLLLRRGSAALKPPRKDPIRAQRIPLKSERKPTVTDWHDTKVAPAKVTQ